MNYSNFPLPDKQIEVTRRIERDGKIIAIFADGSRRVIARAR